MKTKLFKKLLAVFLSIITVFFSLPLQVFAMDNKTNDYTDIKELEAKYSYGTVFWSKDSKVELTKNNTASTTNFANGRYSIWAAYDEVIELKITNSAIDEEGDLCDVILRIDDIELFKNNLDTRDKLVKNYPSITPATNPDDIRRTCIEVSRYANSDLVLIWFNTNSASSHFTMQYLKAGTNEAAKIQGATSTIYDIDIQVTNNSCKGDLWDGNEGFTIDGSNGSVYYKKGVWLTDVDNDKGVRVPDYSKGEAPYKDTNKLEINNSAVAVQDFDKSATFKLFYSGYGCGIAFTFASPYTFKVDKPIMEVDKEIVFEGERFNYSISQYIPNNYYATQLDFFGNAQSWKNIEIVNTLNSNLDIVDDITIKNEDGKNVTSYFDISTNGNEVKAVLKNEYIKSKEFYSHLYTVNIPVTFNIGTGDKTNGANNSASTVFDENNYNTNTVFTALRYKVTVNANIDNGFVKINDTSYNDIVSDTTVVKHSDDTQSKVKFSLKKGYKLSKVIVDNKEVEPQYAFGIYSIIIPDNKVTRNIEHNVTIQSELKKTSVVVNYKDTKGNKLADSIIIDGKVFDKYQTEAKDIYGYELIAVPENAKGEMTEDTIVVNYIYRLKDSKVIVNYKDTEGNKLAESVTINGKVFDQYETEAKTFYGYTLTEVPQNAKGEMTEDVIVVDYIYNLKGSKVIVNYINEAGNKLTDSITINGKAFDKYETEAKSFYGYELTEIPNNAQGEMTENAIVVNYIYRLKDTKVIVNYKDTEGKELSESITIDGKVFDKYQTETKNFYGYELTVVPQNAKGEMTEDVIVVDYIYKLKDTKVIVNYKDTEGKELAESVTIDGKVFDKYKTEAKTFYGYTLTEIPNNAQGEMTEEPIVVDYIYKLKDTKVTVNYVDEKGESLEKSIVIEGKVFDKYQTEAKDIYGYELTEIPNNAQGEMTEEPIIVNYIYRLRDTKVIVNYKDIEGKKLADSITIDGKVFDDYETIAKTFYGYTLTEVPQNATGKMTEDVIVVDYIYNLKGSKVIVNYINEAGNKLTESVTLNGKVFDKYTSEAKDIYGYELTEIPNNAQGEMTEDVIVVNYIYKLKDATVTINYVNEQGESLEKSIIIEGKVFDKYTSEAKDIYGYELTEIPNNAQGEMTEEPIIVNYIYRLKDTKVIVNYKDTEGKELAESVTIEGKVFDKYQTEAKTFYGYTLTAIPQNATGKMTEDVIVVDYIYNIKGSKVIVNYINEAGNKLTDSITIDGKVFDKYQTEAKTFYGYTLTEVPQNAKGEMTEDVIVVDYIYKLKDTKVTVNYVDEKGKSLEESIVIEGKVFDKYTSSAKDIYGYELTEIPNNAQGEMTENAIVVNYIYKLKDTKVIVNYKDTEGKELSESITINGKVFDKYQTEAKTFYGYTLTAIPQNAEGEMTEEPIVVNYIYKLKDTKVIVNYKDTEGKELAESVTIEGKVFDKYQTEAKTFYGYTLTAIPQNAEGKMTEEPIVIDYIYKLKDSKVIVNYKDTEGKELTDSIIINGKVFDQYETEAKTFYGYTLTEIPNNAEGEMTEEPIVVNYIYKLKDATVTFNYVDEKGESLEESIVIEGKVFDKYTSSAKDIYGYELIETPNNAQGEMTEKPIIVNYIYRLKDTKVIVNYKDTEGNKLAESVTLNGKVFDQYETEAKSFYGYELIAVPENAKGEMTEGAIVVNYIYRLKDSQVIVNYKDTEGKELAESITLNGKVFDKYETEAKTFYGYELTVVPQNAKGEMTENVIVVDYIYKLKDTKVIVNYKDTEGKELADSITIDGKVFDKYKTEAKTFYGYELTEIPNNAQGEMAEDVITVDYIFNLKDSQVIVKYVDEAGNSLADSIIINGKVFDKYQTEAKSFYGYELTEVPQNAKGEMTEDTIEVVYTYTEIPVEIIDTGDTNITIKLVAIGGLLVTFIVIFILVSKKIRKK